YVDRRRGVSSETTVEIHSPSKVVKKQLNPETKARIEKCLRGNILFRSLGEDSLEVVYSSMFEKTAEAGHFIMKQYDEGDNFYVIESGTCNILIQPNPDAEPVHKSTIGPGASFGELALMYGTPRAASVQAVSNVRLWALDRDTFRRILLTQTMRKRRQYEDFLAQVPLFEALTSYERMTMADALQPCTFKDKEIVVKEGEDGGSFYIIIDGKMKVNQTLNGRIHTINILGPKDFFGEMSLMFNQPCVATVVSEGVSHCVSLDRESFTALLGPMEEILQRNMQNYSAPREEVQE
uniref:Regulatory Subunit of Protein Kinase A (cAMP-dependent) from Euglena gracilis n=1 Tax=Euglena gracilis TaxID=3039 RepID=UPI00186BC2EB|nr:Chain A, Regulatory Subunit of Protein Kinase A (cAMP-dependent) from Euglena gracilis [Euglena gracilis]